MPEFILDTSREVSVPINMPGHGSPARFSWVWSDLDAFTQGYIEALFFTEQGDGEAGTDNASGLWAEIEPGLYSNDFGFSDLAPEALASIIEDCAAFRAPAKSINEPIPAWRLVELASTKDDAPEFPDDAQAGRDFWYTRNGHGCGFWDGDWPEPHATALTDAAKAFGECSPYVGDDGKVYV